MLTLKTPHQEKARKLAAGPLEARAALYHRKSKYGFKNIKALNENNLWGVNLTDGWRHEFSSLHDTLLIIEELAYHCPQSAYLALEANLGISSALNEFGTTEQKELLAETLARGDKPALCFEEGQNTSLNALEMTARKQGNHYILNGVKTPVIGGDISSFYIVLARLIEDEKDKDLAAFIMARQPARDIHPHGLSIKNIENPKTLSGLSAAQLTFDNVIIPAHHRVYFSDEMAFENALLQSRHMGEAIMALAFSSSALHEARQIATKQASKYRPNVEKLAYEKIFMLHEAALHACRLMLYDAAQTASFINHRLDADISARARLFAFNPIHKAMQFALHVASQNGFQHKQKIERLYEALQLIWLKGAMSTLLHEDYARTIIPFVQHEDYETRNTPAIFMAAAE